MADAGVNRILRVEAPQQVILDGGSSYDPDGDSLSFRWTQLAGPAVVLQDAAGRAPRFPVSPVAVETIYSFQLAVSDGSVSRSDTTSVTLLARMPTSAGGGQIPGDGNQDGMLDISDAVWLLGFLFLGNTSGLPCDGGSGSQPGPGTRDLLDVNGDSGIDISDGVSILGFLFTGGSPPALGIGCVPIAGCPAKCR